MQPKQLFVCWSHLSSLLGEARSGCNLLPCAVLHFLAACYAMLRYAAQQCALLYCDLQCCAVCDQNSKSSYVALTCL